jgi:hypothetical protein
MTRDDKQESKKYGYQQERTITGDISNENEQRIK